jgi:tRNA/rRNA methyltransferase
MKPEVLLSRIRIVLCRPSHPGNIGAAARAMKTMGLGHLSLVSPKQFPDPEADTRATGAVDLLQQAEIYPSLQEALAGTVFVVGLSARRRDLGPEIGEPREMVTRLLAAAAEGEVALVFGNETVGLSNDEIQLCHAAVSIPTNPDFSSLNLGSAVQVAQPGRLMPKLRRLFGRARLEQDEVNILRGILASTQVKTGHGRKA